jgi:hypothetical protein
MYAELATENSINNSQGAGPRVEAREESLGSCTRKAFNRRGRKGKAAKGAEKTWIDSELVND